MPTLNRHVPIDHKKKEENYRKERKHLQAFYHTKEWRVVRQIVLSRDSYLCVMCKAQIANEVDHINPRCTTSKDEWLNPNNLQSLCKKCHSAKTKKEMKFYN